jgi:hypothetical protein
MDIMNPGVKVVSVLTNQYSVGSSNTVTLNSVNNDIAVYPSAGSNTVIVTSNYVYSAGITAGKSYLSNHVLTLQTIVNGNLSVSMNSNLYPDNWNIYSIGSVVTCYLPTNSGLILSNVAVSLVNGNITVMNAALSDLDVSCVNGTINLSNISAAQVSESAVNGVINNDITSVKLLSAMATNGACSYTMDSFRDVSNCSVSLRMLNASCSIKLGTSARSNLLLGVTLVNGVVNNSLVFNNDIISNMNAFVGGNGNQLNTLSVSLLNGLVSVTNE